MPRRTAERQPSRPQPHQPRSSRPVNRTLRSRKREKRRVARTVATRCVRSNRQSEAATTAAATTDGALAPTPCPIHPACSNGPGAGPGDRANALKTTILSGVTSCGHDGGRVPLFVGPDPPHHEIRYRLLRPLIPAGTRCLSTKIVGARVIAAYLRKSQPSEEMICTPWYERSVRSSHRGQGRRPRVTHMPWRSATRSPAGSGNSRVWGRGGVRQIRGDARVESAIGTLNANPVLRRLRREASALYAKLEG